VVLVCFCLILKISDDPNVAGNILSFATLSLLCISVLQHLGISNVFVAICKAVLLIWWVILLSYSVRLNY
jgi:hypothetical protein